MLPRAGAIPRSDAYAAPRRLDADYVVYGAGAMGMAFVDTLVAETAATVVLVDRHAQPGGHWNDAYPFVRLHQPAMFYGVNSRKLERTKDPLELSSRSELLAYYEGVLEALLSSGRVQYFPMCECEDTQSSRAFRSLIEPGKVYEVAARARIVDATYMKVAVPSVSDPRNAGRYEVGDGVEIVPLNELTRVGTARGQYIVIGAGKTGMDAVLWMLGNGVGAERIHWVMPRDAWVINREVFAFGSINMFDLFEQTAKANSVDEYYDRMEQVGMWHRIDGKQQPTRNKCATASPAEMELLRKVGNVVRLGRVRRVERGRVVCADGTLPIRGDALIVDCSSDALATRPAVPVFRAGRITLQAVQTCQQVFSAALLAHIEARGGSDEAKNKLCTPVPHPDTKLDFLRSNVVSAANRKRWLADADLRAWLWKARLNQRAHLPPLKDFLWHMWQNLSRVPQLRGGEERMEGQMRRIVEASDQQVKAKL